MSEINNLNNIRYGQKVEFDKSLADSKKQNQGNSVEESKGREIVPDTGFLGRSQVKGVKGGINVSIDEIEELMSKHPEIAEGADVVFNRVYDRCIKEGKTPYEAYVSASFAQDEFTSIAKAKFFN